MDQPATTSGVRSLYQLNCLPAAERNAAYAQLIPPPLLDRFGLRRSLLLADAAGPRRLLDLQAPADKGYARITLKAAAADPDPCLVVELLDSAYGYTEVTFINLNDPAAPRFNIDRDEAGNDSLLGTVQRNIPAEVAAMGAGLAPGQVRAGLRLGGAVFEQLRQFCASLGQTMYSVEPFAYHNAIIFERHGFGYLDGREQMIAIDRQFQPGGLLAAALDGSSPFRQPAAATTVRGRSWAIQDGILGVRWGGVKLYWRPTGNETSTFDGPY